MKAKRKLFVYSVNIIVVVLIVVSFLYSVFAVRHYAKRDCIDQIEETTVHFAHAMDDAIKDSEMSLTMLTDILVANETEFNSEAQIKKYMENFCKTQFFSATCIHNKDGTVVRYGELAENFIEDKNFDFQAETARLPYVSEVYKSKSDDGKPENRFFRLAVPLVRDDETTAILYGYMTLDRLPAFVSPTAYGGECTLYVLSGKSGDFLMDGHRNTLGNIYDEGIDKVRKGYSMEDVRSDIYEGKSGYFVFRPYDKGDWYYTYYAPIGVNDWTMQLMVEEGVALASYNEVSRVVIAVAIIVLLLMVVHLVVLMLQTSGMIKKDKKHLARSRYVNEVQRFLLNAHNNPDFIEQALKTVAEEVESETVLLLNFKEKTVVGAYYWPSKDREQAMNFIGRNVREDFPVLFDVLTENRSIFYEKESPVLEVSPWTKEFFGTMGIDNMILVPIVDNTGILKGAIAAVNTRKKGVSCRDLECVTYDFFMAITNVETHAIIKNMGAMDYLTGTKNRNSYESEAGEYITKECETLWCVFVDVNGLHEINNALGHKAGDIMLCAVADTMKSIYGKNNVYRFGGDEFVAFAADSTKEEFFKKKKRMVAELAAKNYSVSVGFECGRKEDGIFDIEKIVSAAERYMYKEKKEYYEKNAILSVRGRFPVGEEQKSVDEESR